MKMITKEQAESLAKKVSLSDIDIMFREAAKQISDWKEPSRANPRFDRGAAWNMLYKCFKNQKTKRRDSYAERNYIWCFGEFLPNYKVKDGIFLEPQKVVCNQEPDLSLLNQ